MVRITVAYCPDGNGTIGGGALSRIAVIGTGYVGLTTAACFADLGNEVVGVDIDLDAVATLQRGEVTFFEPGLQEVVTRNLGSGRLRFTSSYEDAVPTAEFVFLAVGTPMGATGEADLTQVREAAAMIAIHLAEPSVVVNKSTVPIGTGDIVSNIIGTTSATDVNVHVVSNPEFLREGTAIHDFMAPDRVVLGAHDHAAAVRVGELYKALEVPVLITTLYSAEMIKYASNAFLATKVSFINEVARICEKVGADIKVVAEGMGLDHRICGEYLSAGLGYGGSCLPKDVQALVHISQLIGAHPQLLHAVMDINRSQPLLLIDKLHDAIGTLDQKTIAMLGLSFKPNTDDMREAPSLGLIKSLQRMGAQVRAYDPAAMETAGRRVSGVHMAGDAFEAVEGADALIVVTEWSEFRQLDLERVKGLMRRPVIIDGRNIYDPAEVRAMGFIYHGVGR
ncbi:MAG TPA: UDP-glucose/GDP-mannose dehydrogenase family protein [Candidatus Dormibacteraeota bacterium]